MENNFVLDFNEADDNDAIAARVISRGSIPSPVSETVITVRLTEEYYNKRNVSEYTVDSAGVHLISGKPSAAAEWSISRLLKSGRRRIEHTSVSNPEYFWIAEIL